MATLKYKIFSNAAALCYYVNENPYIQIVQISSLDGKYTLFYKEEEV